MRRAFLQLSVMLGITAFAWSQSASSDSQALQALLSEVRALRQELRVSLNRTQGMQILLARFQMQEGIVTRASERANEARQKLSDTHLHQREITSEIKRLEEALNSTDNSQQQADLQDRLKHVKSDLDVAGSIAQQQQTTETEAEQQLREEHDKMNILEGQLDELVRATGDSAEGRPVSRP